MGLSQNRWAFLIVLYELSPSQSSAFRAVINRAPKNSLIILYDNSSSCTSEKITDKRVLYQHDMRNLGLATAYNFAVKTSIDNGASWLTILDQDTELSSNFFVSRRKSRLSRPTVR